MLCAKLPLAKLRTSGREFQFFFLLDLGSWSRINVLTNIQYSLCKKNHVFPSFFALLEEFYHIINWWKSFLIVYILTLGATCRIEKTIKHLQVGHSENEVCFLIFFFFFAEKSKLETNFKLWSAKSHSCLIFIILIFH